MSFSNWPCGRFIQSVIFVQRFASLTTFQYNAPHSFHPSQHRTAKVASSLHSTNSDLLGATYATFQRIFNGVFFFDYYELTPIKAPTGEWKDFFYDK
ncbi:MAG TPA: hypothetical protein VIK55_14185 [Paludibacter sp.]